MMMMGQLGLPLFGVRVLEASLELHDMVTRREITLHGPQKGCATAMIGYSVYNSDEAEDNSIRNYDDFIGCVTRTKRMLGHLSPERSVSLSFSLRDCLRRFTLTHYPRPEILLGTSVPKPPLVVGR
jgi:hypothetical protein